MIMIVGLVLGGGDSQLLLGPSCPTASPWPPPPCATLIERNASMQKSCVPARYWWTTASRQPRPSCPTASTWPPPPRATLTERNASVQNSCVPARYWEVDDSQPPAAPKLPYRIELVGVTCDPGLAVARGIWCARRRAVKRTRQA